MTASVPLLFLWLVRILGLLPWLLPAITAAWQHEAKRMLYVRPVGRTYRTYERTPPTV